MRGPLCGGMERRCLPGPVWSAPGGMLVEGIPQNTQEKCAPRWLCQRRAVSFPVSLLSPGPLNLRRDSLLLGPEL